MELNSRNTKYVVESITTDSGSNQTITLAGVSCSTLIGILQRTNTGSFAVISTNTNTLFELLDAKTNAPVKSVSQGDTIKLGVAIVEDVK